jgi:hypothetical protein
VRRPGPKSLSERRTALDGKRAKVLIEKVLDALEADKKERPSAELVAMAAAFGTEGPAWNEKQKNTGWKGAEAFMQDAAEGGRRLWGMIKPRLRVMLHYNDLPQACAGIGDARSLAKYIGLDDEALWAEICAAIPNPKAWANLNADGTAKTASTTKDTRAGKARRAKKAKPRRGVCRECGCTETTPCGTDSGPCAWTDRTRTLCTACAARKEAADAEAEA